VLVACTSLGHYVWVDDYPAPETADSKGYVIRAGDLIQVRVYNQDGMSARSRVRQDGMVSLPFLSDVKAEGYTPAVLSQQLQTRLKDFVNVPVVTVSLEELRPISVSVLGEVPRPGLYNLEAGSGVLQALATAGGFTEFAHRDRLFVVRETPGRVRIRFSYEALSRAEGKASSFRLQSGDTLVVD
jgi:polysaccharide export outer membrane protein